jgi:flagellar biosynthesis GTPase FlhF
MRKLILSFAILVAAHSISYGGLLDRSVDFADLAKLSEEGLQALKDTEFEVFLANVRLARAKATEDLARERLKAAEENLDKERLNLKAAKAEYKAAEANQDAERMSNVEKTREKVKEAIKTAELGVKWREKEVSARKTGVKKAKLGVELSENKRDLARISRLVTEKISSANKYSLADYKSKQKKNQEDYQKAMDKEKREMLEAEQLKAQYEKRAGEG